MKKLSEILIILNPVFGFCMVGSIMYSVSTNSYWWLLIPVFIVAVVYNLKFYFKTHQEESDAYDKWVEDMNVTHEYLGLTPYYHTELWRNKVTNEIEEY